MYFAPSLETIPSEISDTSHLLKAIQMVSFNYSIHKVNELSVETKEDTRSGKRVVSAVLLGDEALQPTERFWTSLYSRYGFSSSVFKYFDHQEVLTRIADLESDRVRVCIERDEERGSSRLLAITNPARPIVDHEELMGILEQYDGQDINYVDGVFESTHLPRIGSQAFEVGGDAFSNRFVLSTPVDGFGLPNIYLSLLRHICSNGAIGYSRAFRSSLPLGSGNDSVRYSIVRALDGFGNDEGFSALRQRFESAAKSWASVYEVQSYFKQLVKLHHQKQIRVTNGTAPQVSNLALESAANGLTQESEGSIIAAFNRMTGDPSNIYGIANPDALSVKRQRTLPVKCSVYDLLNFVSEVATHHTTEAGGRSSQAWLGSLISSEYDIEGSRESFGDFQDFFMERRLNGETALELQQLAS